MPSVYRGSVWGILGSYFDICTYFSRLFVQYFVTKFCSGVLGITLTIVNTKFFWHNVPLLRGHFGVFLDLFWHITSTFWEPFKIFCEALVGIFGLVLANDYLILHNCSIFSHETLYRCSSYNYDGHRTKNCFLYHVPRGSFSEIFLYF